MLTITQAKPIQVTMVISSFKSYRRCIATRLRNCGESAATAMPQITQTNRKYGETKIGQEKEMRQRPEISSEI